MFPQTVHATLMPPVNSFLLGAIPIVFTHWFVRFLGGAPAAPVEHDERTHFASDLPASI